MIIGICDDNDVDRKIEEETCREQIEKHHADKEHECRFIAFKSGEELLRYQEYIDILILDIEMEGISGVEVKNQLNNRDSNTTIIFVTSHEQQVYDAFGVHVHGFVKKSNLRGQLELQFNSACANLLDDKNIIIAGKYNSREIVYIYHEHIYSTLVLSNGKEHEMRISINDLEKILDESDFMQIDRGTLVNMRYIQKISGNAVTMTNGKKYEIASRRIGEFKRQYRQYCSLNGRYC